MRLPANRISTAICGSVGASTVSITPRTGTRPGSFGCITPALRAASVTLASITDGTSNTIAFGEGLVGDYSRTNNYRGNGMSGAIDSAGIVSGTGANPLPGNNAETNPAAVIQALQTCNAFWSTLTSCGGYRMRLRRYEAIHRSNLGPG